MPLIRPLLRGVFAIFLCALTGCKAEAFGGDDLTIDPSALTVIAGTRFAGGSIIISAPWMREMPATMAIGIDDHSPWPAARVHPSAPDLFLIGIPGDLRAGQHDIYLHPESGPPVVIGSISIGGFVELRSLAGSLYGAVQPLPSTPGIVGVLGGEASVPVVLDARHGTLSPLPGVPTTGYGVGGSYRLGRFMVRRPGPGGEWVGVSIGAVATTVDSVAMRGTEWPGHEIAPDLFLKDEKQRSYVQRVGQLSQQVSPTGTYTGPSSVAYSADGQWAVPTHATSSAGLMIIDRSAGTHRWSPGWQDAVGTLFDGDDRLVVFGRRPGLASDQRLLAHLDPATGTVLDSSLVFENGLPFGYGRPATVGPSGWIVLAWVSSDLAPNDRLELSVRHPNSLVEVAHATSPPFRNSCFRGTPYTIVDDASLHRFYVVGSECGSIIPIMTFQLPE